MTQIEDARTMTQIEGGMAETKSLCVRDLEVDVTVGDRTLRAVRGASLSVRPGQIVALIGESGSGKTLTLKAALGLLPPGAHVVGGDLRWGEDDLVHLTPRRWRQVRRSGLVYVPADSASLNPVYRIGEQLAEALDDRLTSSTRRHRDLILRSLASVGLGRSPAESSSIARRYPHQLSGGMRQRALIAMAVERGGAIMVADEPTSGLDMTTQRQVLRLMAELRDTTGLGILITSHDLDLVGEIADEVVVMYAGQVVESGSRAEVLEDPKHPYTRSLLACLPTRGAATQRLQTIVGAPPRLDEIHSGCAFLPRCPRHKELGRPEKCEQPWEPAGENVSEDVVRCWFPLGMPTKEGRA